MLLQGFGVLAIALELRVGGEEAGCVYSAEEVGIENVFGARARLGYLEKEGQTGVLVVLLICVVWRKRREH